MELTKRYKEKRLNNHCAGLGTLSLVSNGATIELGNIMDYKIDYGTGTAIDSRKINTSTAIANANHWLNDSSDSEITIDGGLMNREARETLLGISSLPGNLTPITDGRLDTSYLDSSLYAGNLQNIVGTIDRIEIRRSTPGYYGLEGPDDPPIDGDMMIRDGGKLMYWENGEWREVSRRP